MVIILFIATVCATLSVNGDGFEYVDVGNKRLWATSVANGDTIFGNTFLSGATGAWTLIDVNSETIPTDHYVPLYSNGASLISCPDLDYSAGVTTSSVDVPSDTVDFADGYWVRY